MVERSDWKVISLYQTYLKYMPEVTFYNLVDKYRDSLCKSLPGLCHLLLRASEVCFIPRETV